MKIQDLRVLHNEMQIVASDGEVFDIRDAIARIPWVSATMYPPPHQYVVRHRCPAIPWMVLATAISKHPTSYLAYFRGYAKPNRYLEIDGYRYWQTSAGGAGGLVLMLNRGTFESAEPPRRVDQGAKPAQNWIGPPWDVNGSAWPSWYTQGPDGQYHYNRALDPYRNRL